MKYEERTKVQLIKEMQKIHEKVTELEKVKVMCNQLEKELKQTYKKLQKFIEGTAYIIMKVVETRDPYSTGHQQKVSKLATAIAQEMKLPQDKIEGTKIASLIHDIGKVNLPTEIISKPGKLIDVEFNLIKNYPKLGYDLLKKVDFPWPIAEIVENKNILFNPEVVDTSLYSLKKKNLNFKCNSTVRRGEGDILNKKGTIHCVSTE